MIRHVLDFDQQKNDDVISKLAQFKIDKSRDDKITTVNRNVITVQYNQVP